MNSVVAGQAGEAHSSELKSKSQPSSVRSPSARQALETAVLCVMSTHGLWAGPVRRNLLICPSVHTDAGYLRELPRAARALSLMYSNCNSIANYNNQNNYKIIQIIQFIQILMKSLHDLKKLRIINIK